MKSMRKDEIGNRYGRLIVTGAAEKKSPKIARWTCKCECGNLIEADGQKLRKGVIKSCGCFRQNRTWNRKFVAFGNKNVLDYIDDDII